jgi:8-amino-7-oxononanoate synthase
VHVYRHRDCNHLEQLLNDSGSFRRRLLVTDTVFSMHGDLADLAPLAELAERFALMLMVDEAHATGIFGDWGCGRCDEEGVAPHVVVRVGTLSKSLGGIGGFVAGSQRLIDWLVNRARPYVFSTAAPAVVAAAGLAALNVVRRRADWRTELVGKADNLRHRLQRLGFDTGGSQSQIVPVILGGASRTLAAAAELRRRGFFVPPIRPPSVPEGQSLLRISLTYLHTEKQIDDLVAALRDLAR